MILSTTGKIHFVKYIKLKYICICKISLNYYPSFFIYSAESGFSDERGDDTDEEDNAVEERIRLGPRRRPRKVEKIYQ